MLKIDAALHGQARLALDELRAAMSTLLGQPSAEEAADRLSKELDSPMLELAARGVILRVVCNVSLDALPVEVSRCLCRIAAEALRNVLRHTRARRVCLRLQQCNGRAELVVSGDGQGLWAGGRAGSGYGGLGIALIRRQAEQLGGWLRLDSTDGSGTRLTASLPLHRRASPLPPAHADRRGKETAHGRA